MQTLDKGTLRALVLKVVTQSLFIVFIYPCHIPTCRVYIKPNLLDCKGTPHNKLSRRICGHVQSQRAHLDPYSVLTTYGVSPTS